MRRLIVIAAILAGGLGAPARAEPAYTADELKQLDALLDFACANKRGEPGLTCSRGAIALHDKAKAAQKPAPTEPADKKD